MGILEKTSQSEPHPLNRRKSWKKPHYLNPIPGIPGNPRKNLTILRICCWLLLVVPTSRAEAPCGGNLWESMGIPEKTSQVYGNPSKIYGNRWESWKKPHKFMGIPRKSMGIYGNLWESMGILEKTSQIYGNPSEIYGNL